MNNILKRVLGIGFACMLLLTMLLLSALAVHTQKALQNELASTFGTAGKNVGEFEGKTLSILGASMSTYTGISNNPDYNSTIGNNAVYYTAGKHGVYADDTWWMQVCSDMGLRLMVNNSWSGSSLLHERNGTVGAYVDRCVQLHNNAGEDPDIIAIQMGTNDFQYYKDTLGTADIDYSALITENGDGTYTYSTPVTSLEAAAIVLHKISVRYPNAEVYYLNISQRIDGTDDLIRSFNAELKQVVEHFGAHIVDIYGSAITMETFRTYIGDGRVHTNCLGMDAYTEAFKRSLIANTSYSVNTHTVSMQLDGVTADYGDDKIVVDGDAFEVNLSASAGDVLDVSVTMGGKDITLSAYANGKVTIAAVTDDVVITAASVHEPKDYRWEFDGSDLACVKGENTLTKNAGTTTDGVFANTRYALAYSVVLLHNEPWVVEWKCEGTFQNSGGSSGARIFTSTDVNAEYNARYIFKSNTNGLIAMGEKTSTGSHNYGIALGDHGIDWTALHTYRLENRIAADGSNMIWLYVDGEEIGPMTGYYIGTKAQNTTSDWLSGKDFTFPYMGTDTHGFTNAAISYICVAESTHTHAYIATVTAPTCTEGGYTTNTCTICGDSYVDGYTDAKGHSYENGMCTVCGSAAPMDTVTTTDALVAAIRQAMVQRQTSIQLRLEGIALTSSDVSAAITQACAHTGLPNEGDYIRANMLGYSWSLTTGSDANGAYSIISITCNFISDAQMEAEVDAAVDQLLSELNLWDASNYEKVKGVYDWITENISYDYEWDDIEDDTAYYKHTTHAALIQKNAVCQGFASLYYRLMLELGVDCRYISGISTDITGTENHAWNIVYLDGKYFNCDPTWDRSLAGHYRYFLCTEANFSGHTRDAEYDTAQFHADYPMAVTPYVQNVTASGTVNSSIEWVLDGDTGTLTVAGTGAIPSYRYSDAPWYAYRESVKKIVVSEGITEVGERAFYWCVNCTEVDLPDSLVAIREYGFNNLRNLKNITLPSNLKTIEFCAFSECVALVSITLPDSVTTVGSNAFSNCTALTSAVLSNGMTSIPSSMFGNDSKLKKVVLPEGITYIDDTAFINCGFTEITLPASVTKLGTSVFSGCTYLSRFIVEEGNTAFKAVDGVLFSADGTHLICYPAAKFGDYTVPEGTVYIDYGAFRSQKYMNYVYFPSTLTKIDGYAFSYCYNLIRVTFNSNITTIGSDAFRSCTGLVSVTFENPNVTLVGYTFAGCTALRTIKLPSNLSQIPNGLFYGCTNLQSISIPSTVTKIGSSAFLDCDSLVSVTVPGTVESIGQQAFDFCNKLETVVFEEGVTTLGWICIRNAPKLKKVVIPSTVTKIEQPSNTTSYLFDDCPNVVVYVICGSYGHSYAISRGLAYQASHTVTPTIVLPTCTEEGYTHYTCPCGANDYYTDYTPALGHDYHGVTTSPTCTEAGYTTYTCTRCADSFIDDYVAASHSFEAWDILTEATCTTDGEKRRDCVVCDYYEMITIPATGHSYASAVTEPTCTEKGYTTHTCTTCGDSYKDSYLDAKGHTPGAQATCTTAQICAVCNLELVAAFGHDEVYHEAKIPTCTEIGWDAYVTCSRCDYSTYAEKAALGHDEVHHEAKAPTCTEIGWDAYVSCSRCDYGTYVEKAALGHDEVHHEAKTPTCTEIGWDAYVTCSRCDYSTYAGKAALGHDEVHHEAKTPTCTEIGWDAYVTCSRCDYSTYAEKVALGHDEVHHEAKAPTCTEIGWDAYVTCSRCDYSTYAEKAAFGHTEVVDVAVAPTCTATGLTEGKHCSVCGEVLVAQQVIAAIDHDYSAVVTEPTCTDKGYTTHICTNCGASYTSDHTDALGHSYDIAVTEPTCMEPGSITYTCHCGDTYTEVVPATGHESTHLENAKDATCGADGYTGDWICNQCGATVENGMVISATGSHQYGDWVVITEPTTKDSGLREHTCVNCGHTEQEIMDPIAALMGDVNGDGRINARDARVLLRYLAGLAEESGLDLVAADYNGDGHVNARDARTILRYIAGMN